MSISWQRRARSRDAGERRRLPGRLPGRLRRKRSPFDILALGCELEEELGVGVDVCTSRGPRAFVKDEVFAEAVSL